MKLKMITVSLVLAFAFIACGKGNAVGEAKALMNEMISTMEKTNSGMEKAEDGDAAAEILESFADSMLKMKTKSEELSKKYPELNLDGSEPPPELKEEAENF